MSDRHRIKARDWNAVSAHFRQGGAMKDRRTPRGGARNEHRDLLDAHRDDLAADAAEADAMFDFEGDDWLDVGSFSDRCVNCDLHPAVAERLCGECLDRGLGWE